MLAKKFQFFLLLTITLFSIVVCFVASPKVLDSKTSRLVVYSMRKTQMRGQHVPLLGPIPGGAPLLVGGEMTLDPPTPMQWQSLYESVILHHLRQENSDSDITGIDAAPLVAIIDDVTGKRSAQEEGRYATLAAVVGISPSLKSKGKLDTSDETSFMESLSTLSTEARSPLSSRIRLVGVGRANLRDYFHKVPTTDLENHEDEEDGETKDPPIVMAEFDFIEDNSRVSGSDYAKLGNKGARSVFQSPVHAINEINRLSNRVSYLHNDRRRLVQGCKAAKARLEQANFHEDFDGIGQLTSSAREEEIELIEELLTKYNQGDSSTLDTSVLASKENYGLGYYAAFSPLPALKKAALTFLEPYYSPIRRAEEEYEMEVASFVAFRALEGFCDQNDVAWALQITNSAERFDRVYDIMSQHARLLERMAQQMSHDLMDCGEECTDLW